MKRKLNQQKSCDDDQQPRRNFLARLWMFLGGAALVEAGWVASDFLGPRRNQADDKNEETLIQAGSVDNFTPGSVTAFQRGGFYLVRLEDGGFLALSRKCTHLGCTVPWVEEEGRFICPCHASSFDIHGEVMSPPAPRPLDLYSVRIENKTVKVEIMRPIKRSRFSKDQVARA
jgi:cytochrome b6-f complex iron-sulfur subunit